MKILLQRAMMIGGIGIMASLSGCSYLNVGENDFSCPGKGKGVSCASSREMYEATNNGQIPKPVSKDEVEEMAERGQKISTVKGVEDDRVVLQTDASGKPLNTEYATDEKGRVVSVTQRIEDNYVAPALPNKPVPIRTPAVVMRIWIAPWEDAKGDLNYSGFVYTEIEPRRWVVGNDARGASRTFNPLSAHSHLNK
jgi:conjugal transfer pilus assembly protein TraV